MSFDTEKLYNLLPAVYRDRDAQQGFPLKQLLEAIVGQVEVLEENLEQLYDNHFVETAAPWALPYLGELLGIRALPSGAIARSPRAEVGHTVAYRRRKGTTPTLELLAHDITGWPARAVEFFDRLAATQHLNHLRPGCQSFASLRNSQGLEFVGTPFEPLMRTVEVRRIEPSCGKWNIPNLGLFLWRLKAFSRTESPLVLVGELHPGDPLVGRRFRLHPLSFDAPLYSRPVTEGDISHLAEPINVPLPISRRRLADTGPHFHPNESLYGAAQSLAIELLDVDGAKLLPANRVVVCDLSDSTEAGKPVWNHESKAAGDQVALDPVLGRVVFGVAPDNDQLPRASFHLGFCFELGGGEYTRSASFEADVPTTILVPKDSQTTLANFNSIADALSKLGTKPGGIEISTSGRFIEPPFGKQLPSIIANGVHQEIRASDKCCPVVLLTPDATGQPWTIRGDANGSVTLNGLWLLGSVQVLGDLSKFALRHCTIPPGLSVDGQGAIFPAPGMQLALDAKRLEVQIENCIIPPLRVGNDGVHVRLRNCIIDAGSEDKFALSNLTQNGPAGSWVIENCTIIGKVSLDVLELASNCIFFAESVFVRRRQAGCMRFSWLPNSAQTRTPRRYQCLPTESGENMEIHPQFSSTRFGDPTYMQLSRRCHISIRTGADDGSELGAFHNLFQPQRDAQLKARMAEYLRFGLEAGVFYES